MISNGPRKTVHNTASPWLSGWLGPEKVPGNQKKKSQSLIMGIMVLRGIISKKSQ